MNTGRMMGFAMLSPSHLDQDKAMMGFAMLSPSYEMAQVNRVLDLRHASKMEQVEAALAALGLRLIVDVARAG